MRLHDRTLPSPFNQTIAGAATASKTSLQGNGPASYNVLMKSRISDSKTRRHAARIAPSVGHGVHPWCALGPSRCLQHLDGPLFRNGAIRRLIERALSAEPKAKR